MKPITTVTTGLAAVVLTVMTTAASAKAGQLTAPAGALPRAIIALGRQAGVTIVTSDPTAMKLRVRAVRGASTVAAALRTMLSDSGYEAVQVDRSTYLIRKSRRTRRMPLRQPPSPPTSTPIEPEGEAEIVVTAAKMPQPLTAYSGTVQVVTLDESGVRHAEGRGTSAIVDELPVMASTGLGPGRDKLFVRGIADSSFTGTTQATVGQYLGEVRLNYNAPDPNLALYDLSRVELLEGPQATLYGAGSLGGILRFVPRPPVHGATEGSFLSNVSVAANGRIGNDVAGVVNLPLTHAAVVRAVTYAGFTPGLVDDTLRNLRGVGRSRMAGGRLAIDVLLGNSWSLAVGGAYQRIKHDDARYAEGSGNPPSRSSLISQPAKNQFGLIEAIFRKRWDNGLDLVSATAVVDNALTARYDLSSIASAVVNDSRNDSVVVSNETRLSRSSGSNVGWVAGVHGISSIDHVTIALRRGARPLSRTRIGTGVVDVALFGQSTFELKPEWTATLGGRLSYSEVRIVGTPPQTDETTDLAPLKRGTLRVLPSAAIAWQPERNVTLYARYQRGYRAGGVAILPLIDPVSGDRAFNIEAFRPDTIDMIEAGARAGDRRTSQIIGTVALSATRWRNVQADVIDTYGPYTANVGDARILGLEGSLTWRPNERSSLSGAMFLARATQGSKQLGKPLATRLTLPNIPLLTFRLSAQQNVAVSKRTNMLVNARARYVGRSEIGVGGASLLRQGNYLEIGAGVETDYRGSTIFLEIDNLSNVRSNRFGLGNPYTSSNGDQRIPLQSRTLRLGLRRAFP